MKPVITLSASSIKVPREGQGPTSAHLLTSPPSANETPVPPATKPSPPPAVRPALQTASLDQQASHQPAAHLSQPTPHVPQSQRLEESPAWLHEGPPSPPTETSRKADSLEDIQVKRMLGQFQKTKSPEKPLRKNLPTGRERLDTEEASRNVMAMARKFNAMAAPT